ncbi:hypothetical protein INR49_017435 [Caranx melampygus]|nr:hypothetical protein INR49_017435 [Caranx melampygus]
MRKSGATGRSDRFGLGRSLLRSTRPFAAEPTVNHHHHHHYHHPGAVTLPPIRITLSTFAAFLKSMEDPSGVHSPHCKTNLYLLNLLKFPELKGMN